MARHIGISIAKAAAWHHGGGGAGVGVSSDRISRQWRNNGAKKRTSCVALAAAYSRRSFGACAWIA